MVRFIKKANLSQGGYSVKKVYLNIPILVDNAIKN